MNVLISTNSAYFEPTMAMLYSLFSSHGDLNMDVYLPYSDIRPEELEELRRFVGLFPRKRLFPIPVDPAFSKRVVSNHGISIETYYRILAIELLPETIERILYLDVDLIVRGSLLELYQMDMEGHPFVVCEDILGILNDFHESNKLRLEIPKEYSYFNAGVMLFNLKYLRETGAAQKLINRIFDNYERYEYNDQDVLNEVYYDQLLWADWDQYNLPPALYFLDAKALRENHVRFASYEELRELSAENPEELRTKYLDISYSMRDKAKIIHYMGAAKPWNRDLTQHDAAVYRFYDEPYWRNAFLSKNRKGESGRWFHQSKGDLIRQLLGVGYSYYYLKNRLRSAGKSECQVWILGSSYAAQGVFDAGEPQMVNLSAPSQDLFCDRGLVALLLAERPEKNLGNRVCILILGYYALYDDMSRAGEKVSALMRTTYAPLIGSAHYCEGENFDIRESFRERYPQMDEGKIEECEEWIDCFFDENDYFNAVYTREGNDPDYQGHWALLESGEKERIGRLRAERHNRLIRHREIYEENCEILQDMLKKVYGAGIPIYIVIPPFTPYYRENLDSRYQTELLEALDQMPVPVEYYDLNETELFKEEDFFDSDHLNDLGARKLTMLIKQMIEVREQE